MMNKIVLAACLIASLVLPSCTTSYDQFGQAHQSVDSDAVALGLGIVALAALAASDDLAYEEHCDGHSSYGYGGSIRSDRGQLTHSLNHRDVRYSGDLQHYHY
jgi:hypothetical protein